MRFYWKCLKCGLPCGISVKATREGITRKNVFCSWCDMATTQVTALELSHHVYTETRDEDSCAECSVS